MRKQFVKSVLQLMEKDPKVVLLLGDIGVFGFREAFVKYPKRVYNIGILEQSTIGLAAGLATEGFKPIVHTIAPFLVERAFEQLKLDFGYQNLPGLFVSVGASYDYAGLGCTHHCPADVSLIENIPNFQIIVPGDVTSLETHLKEFPTCPTYIRMSETTNRSPYRENYPIGNGDATSPMVVAVGPTVDMALKASEGLMVNVLYTTSVRPFQLVVPGYGIPRVRFVIEPYYSSHLVDKVHDGYCNAQSFSIPRNFVLEYGKNEDIYEQIGFTAEALREKLLTCTSPC